MIDLPPFPPGFHGNPLTFALALFSLTIMCLTAVSALFAVYLDWRREKRPDFITEKTGARSELYKALRAAVGCYSVFLLFGALPDVLYLLLWGEVSIETLGHVMVLDRLFDGLILAPFLVATGLVIWAAPSVQQAVAQEGRALLPHVGWVRVRAWIRVPAAVVIIATGVTIGKAYS